MWSPGLRPLLDHLRQPEVGLPLRYPVRASTGTKTTQPTMTRRRKNKEGDWEVWQDLPTTPFSRKTKILSLLLFFFFLHASPARAASVRLSDVRKGESHQVIRKPQSQEMMFQPIGDYAMDVNWMHIRFELNLAKAEEHTTAMKDQLRALDYRQVPKCSGHCHGRDVQSMIGRSWPNSALEYRQNINDR